jgi:hypothetical protein
MDPMLFASTSLAARIEKAECRLLADTAEAAARRHPGTGVFATPLAAGIDVAPSPFEELPVWQDVVVTGFASPDDQG